MEKGVHREGKGVGAGQRKCGLVNPKIERITQCVMGRRKKLLEKELKQTGTQVWNFIKVFEAFSYLWTMLMVFQIRFSFTPTFLLLFLDNFIPNLYLLFRLYRCFFMIRANAKLLRKKFVCKRIPNKPCTLFGWFPWGFSWRKKD